MVTERQTLGEFMALRRQALGLSTRELGRLTGVSYGYISKIERGDVKSPSVDAVGKLAKGLRLPVETLDRVARGMSIDQADDDAQASELMALLKLVPPERMEAARRMLRSLAE